MTGTFLICHFVKFFHCSKAKWECVSAVLIGILSRNNMRYCDISAISIFKNVYALYVDMINRIKAVSARLVKNFALCRRINSKTLITTDEHTTPLQLSHFIINRLLLQSRDRFSTLEAYCNFDLQWFAKCAACFSFQTHTYQIHKTVKRLLNKLTE